VSLLRAPHGGRKRRGFEQQVDEALLVFKRQADNLGFIEGSVRHLLGRGNHEIADAATLEFGGPFDDSERTRRNACFDPRCTPGLLGHRLISLLSPLYGIVPDNGQTHKPAAALIQDPKQRGMLDSTLVVWAGEFGRTPMVENPQYARRKQCGPLPSPAGLQLFWPVAALEAVRWWAGPTRCA
jgi:hypothetical protein